MKINKINIMLTAAACLSSALLLTACSDDWNDHYDEASTHAGTLWSAISSNPDLSNFASVLKACDYDRVLNGNQTFSVFAPTNEALSKTQADSLIQVYNEQSKAGVRSDNNTVVRQFVQNHLSVYKHPVSSLTNDSISMMNGKYEPITASSLGSVPLASSNQLYSNGVLFTMNSKLNYFPNVFEYLGLDKDLDSTYNFLNSYTTYEFDESKSVPGGIKDGKTVYLDSVTTMENKLLDMYGSLNTEDSTYWMIAPTNKEWNRLLSEYSQYYVYPATEENADSLHYLYSRLAIVGGAMFSRTTNSDAAINDSIYSTQALSYSNRRYLYGDNNNAPYVYYHPFAADGIFSGTTPVTCSNGKVFKADNFKITREKTFCQPITIDAEYLSNQDEMVNTTMPLTVRDVEASNKFYDKISNHMYIEAYPEEDPDNPNAWKMQQLNFNLSGILSNVPYDVYVVFAPALAGDSLASADDRLPNVGYVSLNYLNEKGVQITSRRVKVESKPDVVDSVLVYSQFKFPTATYGLSTVTSKLRFINSVKRSETSKYSRVIRIDCILLKPHFSTTESAYINRKH